MGLVDLLSRLLRRPDGAVLWAEHRDWMIAQGVLSVVPQAIGHWCVRQLDVCNYGDEPSIERVRTAVARGEPPVEPDTPPDLLQDWWELYAAWPQQSGQGAGEFAVVLEMVHPYEPFDGHYLLTATRVDYRPDWGMGGVWSIDVSGMRQGTQ